MPHNQPQDTGVIKNQHVALLKSLNTVLPPRHGKRIKLPEQLGFGIEKESSLRNWVIPKLCHLKSPIIPATQ